MASIFTKIINGEIPSYKIAENDKYIAILDAFPLVEGHVLVIPKKEVDKIFDLDKETYLGLMDFSYEIAQAIEKAIPCLRVGVAVVGLEVPHVHVHLVPLNTMQDINFSNPKLQLSAEKMIEIADNIKSYL
ncbi:MULTISPECIES: HIT family protein [Empedobacter]|uniref:HIT domain n=1 Tax=Empedobacter falsenii TaxID=343874 RepID=A0A376G7N5_9FLAO|nr:MULTISPECIES: HIT domain-containing protein [Empedobacter]MBW1619780.1 HIT domain-containing protein [Empedobacter falsenii]MBY0067949.1 HIT domain-containing protein [Empedobacter falsenii]MDH0675453.1 HIT domain-containing protein [Empedobacter sp. GD03861]MDH1603143.1 HIT domain-containing protein [Empedobacter sp. GD03739]MDH2207622.1 HIT domain-containing protein [Empedobacter sp. GD03644]